jgi:hypothetical protein
MKKSIQTSIACLAATVAMTLTGFAQTAVTSSTTTTTTSDGTISEFSPDTLVIRSDSAPQPIRYSYTKTTRYVDESGAPVSVEMVKSGLPVTVHYIKEGDRMIADRVIVHKRTTTTTGGAAVEKKSTTTTTTVK